MIARPSSSVLVLAETNSLSSSVSVQEPESVLARPSPHLPYSWTGGTEIAVAVWLMLYLREARFPTQGQPDRKSTRLNSSHGYISYAVFCLKKKNIVK